VARPGGLKGAALYATAGDASTATE
jgi:hypothetical protein